MTGRGELLLRYEGNPILTASHWPSTVNAVFNPGVSRLDGETVLLVRVEDRTGISHLCPARSADGLTDTDAGEVLRVAVPIYLEFLRRRRSDLAELTPSVEPIQ